MLKTFYYIFSVIYTFKFWGVWYGIIGLLFPIFHLIDLANMLIDYISNK